MKINKMFLGGLAAVAMLAAFASSTMGDQVTVDRIPGYYSSGGGEFTLTPISGELLECAPRGFQSFCLEYEEPAGPIFPVNYYYQLNSGAIAGGVGGNPDPISVGTALLFCQFAQGILANYDYTPGAGREGSAYLLQNAIWWLEQEIELSLFAISVNPFLSDAVNGVLNIFGDAAGAKADAGANNYGVSAINMGTTADGNDGTWPKQDMLVYCPVPDGGTTLIMLGMAMTALVAVQRRIRAA